MEIYFPEFASCKTGSSEIMELTVKSRWEKMKFWSSLWVVHKEVTHLSVSFNSFKLHRFGKFLLTDYEDMPSLL